MSKKKNCPQVQSETQVKVQQRDKIKSELLIKEPNWSENQKKFLELALDKESKVIFVSGLAGTAKTFISVYCSLKLLNEKKVSDIIYIRSAVESADSKLGYLPGSLDDKIHPYAGPLLDKLDEFLSKPQVDNLIKDKRATTVSPNFIRGASWNAKAVIVDEAQNLTSKELITVLTRLGKFTKTFVVFDPSQSDLPKGKSGIEDIFPKLQDDEAKKHGIYSFEFKEEDIVRSELTRFLASRFSKK